MDPSWDMGPPETSMTAEEHLHELGRPAGVRVGGPLGMV